MGVVIITSIWHADMSDEPDVVKTRRGEIAELAEALGKSEVSTSSTEQIISATDTDTHKKHGSNV